MAQKEYLRPDEIASILDVSVRSVYNLINNVEDPLPSIKFGGTIRVSKDKFNTWVDSHENRIWE